MSIELLLAKQNPDGGWPYVRGKSWTEPSVYAVLALQAAGEQHAAQRGLQWIRAGARADGGWAPQSEVDQSTWVTGLVALLPAESLGNELHRRALGWLSATSGQETSMITRVRLWLRGVERPPEQQYLGWPWMPGAAAWVGPTSIAILALEKANQAPERVREGREFLLARMCQEGGWNHGSARALGYDGLPYPETTGMALAALRGVQSDKIDRAMQVASRFLAESRSADAANWLRLGMLAHGRAANAENVPPRTLQEASMRILVSAAESGKSVFWGVKS